jgi:hypothetical protein
MLGFSGGLDLRTVLSVNNYHRWLAALAASIVLVLGSTSAATAATPGAAPVSAWSESPAREVLDRAINPDDHVCGPTPLDAFMDGLMAEMTDADLDFLENSFALDIPTIDALLFGTAADPDYAVRSDYRQLLTKTFRDARRFWDIESADIQLAGMHGDMLQDTFRVARVLRVAFGMPAAAAAAEAREIADTVTASPALDGGNNPLFTLNAFAFSAEVDSNPLVADVPDKLVIGDGMLDALEFMGIGKVGSQVVLAHEFGHHVQFENDLLASPLPGPEATRRVELMADAFATYFATHARGLSLNAKRVLEAQRTFFAVGDCAFDHPAHHGTPIQRERAAAWAADHADSARPQGHILSSMTLAALFEERLPDLVAPDASDRLRQSRRAVPALPGR